MKKFIVLAQIIFLAVNSYGQQYPYFSQYFLNPYLYNPAAIGNSGFNELNFTYRQQWLGINDAPTTQAFNFQYPTRKNISLGVNFYHDQTVLLNTSSLTLGLAYQVSFSDDHFMKFGLSSGIGLNNFALDEVDNPNDPALNDVLNQTTFLSGQFGVFYNLKGLKLGFSLPQLYKYSAIDTVDFQKITIDQLDNYILTASYRFNLGAGNLSLEPFGLYRKSELLPSIIEGGAMLDYKDLFWVGGSYRKGYGGTGYVGFNIKKNISFAYAYEFAGGQQVSLGSGSHEFNLKIRFGKNKHKKETPMLVQNEPSSNPSPKPGIVETPLLIVTPIVVETQALELQPEQFEADIEPIIEPEEEELFFEDIEEEAVQIEDIRDLPDPNFEKPKPTFTPGCYVVLGAFELFDNVVRYSELLNKKGIKAKYGYVEDRGLYYLYNLQTQNFNEARQMQIQLMKLGEFKDAWVYNVR